VKVGVYLGQHLPDMGGVHTFEAELLRALKEAAGSSRHDFVVFSWSRVAEAELTQKVKFVFLSQKVWRRAGWRFRDAGTRFGGWVRNEPWVGQSRGWVERVVAGYGIEVMCNFAHAMLTEEIPYISIVLDLQHRLQPFFPEVSVGGEWDRRERHYGRHVMRAARLITGTRAGKAELQLFYQVPEDRIAILPHPTPSFPPEDQGADPQTVVAKYGIPSAHLFYPAQFWPHKNHVGLLLAARLMQEKYGIALPVVLVGSDRGNERYVRRLAVDWGLADRVYFLGFVPREDLRALYRSAFALVFPSFFGPENLPPLEAFAVGCPVVAARVPGAEEQLGDAALLVDPRKPDEIAAAIYSLHTNPELRRTLVERGTKRAARFTGSDFVAGLLSILNEFESTRRCWGSKGPLG
jgi:glycosyltransferase involved in cell wall biosynthesis